MTPEWFCTKCYAVFMSAHARDCVYCHGEIEEFSPEKHWRSLVSRSNAWGAVWEKWEKHPLLQEVSSELAEEGCFSAATCLNAFIEKLLDALAETDSPRGVEHVHHFYTLDAEDYRHLVETWFEIASADAELPADAIEGGELDLSL